MARYGETADPEIERIATLKVAGIAVAVSSETIGEAMAKAMGVAVSAA